MSFKEPRRNSLKVREDGNMRSFRDTSKQLHEENDKTPPDQSEGGDNREAPVPRENAPAEEGEESDRGRAPKFSTVLRNFRPPSLAKFVPKPKSSSNTGCDV